MAPPACRRHRRTDKDAGRRSVRRSKLKEINSFVMSTLDSEIDPRMDQRLEDCVLDKTRYSSFYNTSLEVILRVLGVDTLIICRVTTEICVESTIRDAYFRDFKILVPKDAVAAMDIDCHNGTLATIEYGFGSVTTSTKLINDLLGIAA